MPIIFNKNRRVGKFIAKMKIQKVPPNENRPDGYKVNFILLNRDDFSQVLLVDNHAPLGYHMHPDPDDPKKRVPLNVSSPFEALEVFEEKVKEICRDE